MKNPRRFPRESPLLPLAYLVPLPKGGPRLSTTSHRSNARANGAVGLLSQAPSERNCLENREGGVSSVLFAEARRQKRASLPCLSTHGSARVLGPLGYSKQSLPGFSVNKGKEKGRNVMPRPSFYWSRLFLLSVPSSLPYSLTLKNHTFGSSPFLPLGLPSMVSRDRVGKHPPKGRAGKKSSWPDKLTLVPSQGF
jgi:hypothetical protein